MNKKELEELIYDYGHTMYRLGRMETDGNSSTKEYNNMTKKKEELTKKFDEFFKTSIKL
ncbi:MAG: hypothetical protein H7831_06470 [Magnetococcus sp. WYHC-3]